MISKSQVKYIQSLGQKKFRDEAGVFVAEGPKIINELLAESLVEPVALYATKAWIDEQSTLQKKIASATINEISEAELERISFLSTPNKVMGIFKKPPHPGPLRFSKSVYLMLDGIQDPGNMGTIIRIADWFAIAHLLCSPDCADAFAPKVVQSSMGSIARVHMHYGPLLSFIKENRDLKLYAATLTGTELHQVEIIQQGIIIIGNESKGIAMELVDLSHSQVTIPKKGKAESLNAAVATGIILSHLVGG